MQQEKTEIVEACPHEETCKEACSRKEIWLKQRWFGPWLDFVKGEADECSYRIEPTDLFSKLLKGQ